jgi:hypothetical protein
MLAMDRMRPPPRWRRPSRWLALLALLLAACLSASSAEADPLPVVRVGVLKFGTVNWEIEVMRRDGLDRAQGIVVKPWCSPARTVRRWRCRAARWM